MKKFTKVCLILAAVLVVAGIAFCIAGAVCGVDYNKLRELPIIKEEVKKIIVTEESVGSEFDGEYTGIRNLELDIGVTDMDITESGDEVLRVYGSNLDNSFKCRQDGDTLKIESKGKVKLNGGMGERVTIEVPEGTVFEKVDLEAGVGSLEADRLYCRDLKIECGVGSVTVNGRVDGECEIDGGVGEVALNLENAKDDFNYDILCGIGEVILGENSYSGISKKKKIDNGSEHDMDIDCGVGTVIVTFSND